MLTEFAFVVKILPDFDGILLKNLGKSVTFYSGLSGLWLSEWVLS